MDFLNRSAHYHFAVLDPFAFLSKNFFSSVPKNKMTILWAISGLLVTILVSNISDNIVPCPFFLKRTRNLNIAIIKLVFKSFF